MLIKPSPEQERYVLPNKTKIGGRYEIKGVLGIGGFGITYLATDTRLERNIAIKEFFPWQIAKRNGNSEVVVDDPTNIEHFTNFTECLKNFLEEAKRLAKFDGCPIIIKIYDYVVENQVNNYIVMEYAEGETLQQRIIGKPDKKISWYEALSIMMPVMDALKVLHKANLLHLDISPQNIYITHDNKIKLLDFGSARSFPNTSSSGALVVVNEGFSPIELYGTRTERNPCTDVYSVSATLYQ